MLDFCDFWCLLGGIGGILARDPHFHKITIDHQMVVSYHYLKVCFKAKTSTYDSSLLCRGRMDVDAENAEAVEA